MGIARSWRTRTGRYMLEGRKCEQCNKYYFPMRNICSNCLTSETMKKYVFSGKGKIVEWTRIDEAASRFDLQVPYYYGIIELDEGVKISSQIIVKNEEDMKVGAKTRMTFRILTNGGKEGVIEYGYKAELDE